MRRIPAIVPELFEREDRIEQILSSELLVHLPDAIEAHGRSAEGPPGCAKKWARLESPERRSSDGRFAVSR